MKVSKTQLNVLEKLDEGWELIYTGGWRMWKPGPVDGFINVRQATVDSLFRGKLIREICMQHGQAACVLTDGGRDQVRKGTQTRFKLIDDDLKAKVAKEVKLLLHAHRDCLRNRGENTLKITFKVTDGYYGEAFGIIRGLELLGYGKIDAVIRDGLQEGYDQKEQSLGWWFNNLEREVLEEEGFNKHLRCDWCKARYGKDDRSLVEAGKLNMDQ
jgi:hypothetical protein